jgi:uncharacterized membrane protein
MIPYRSGLDSISIFIASLCIVHCIVLPVFLTTLPLWGFEVLENTFIEIATVLTALLAGGWAIFRGYREYHKSLSIVILFVAGLGSMTAANFLNDEALEMLLKGMGAIVVVAAHIWTRRKCTAMRFVRNKS